ncbi:MAG TPA: glycosyltransferase, partial [Gemmatimonadales bacterium]|nr:glycosyltransferase [Gemmatimonadales bacterium]
MSELSIVIATYNRVGRLRACLDALRRQTEAAGNFEVLVVVDGSTDGTREMLATYETPFKLRVLWQENAGQPN